MTHISSFAGVAGAVAALAAMAAVNSWTSRINQFFFFSRTAPAAFAATAPARRITSLYRSRVRIGLAVALLAFSAMVVLTSVSLYACFCTALLLECICCCAAFAKAHRAAGAAIAECSVDDQQGTAPQGTAVAVPLLDPGAFTRPLLAMLMLAPVTAAAAWIAPMLALHMGFNAFADAIAANRAEFLTGLGMGLMFGSLLLYVQLRYFSRHRSPMARFTARGCVQLAWLGSAALAFSTLSVPLHLVITKQIKMLLLAVVLAVAIARVIYGWARARLFPPPAIERNGDQFWRWGLFYYNPSDPTLFIQHRSGPGYTVNFAHRMSWPLALLVVADLVFLVCIHIHR